MEERRQGRKKKEIGEEDNGLQERKWRDKEGYGLRKSKKRGKKKKIGEEKNDGEERKGETKIGCGIRKSKNRRQG